MDEKYSTLGENWYVNTGMMKENHKAKARSDC